MKKRHQITLTEENVKEAHELLQELGLGKPALSAFLDDQITNFLPILRNMAASKREGKQLTFEQVLGDVFQQMGKVIKE